MSEEDNVLLFGFLGGVREDLQMAVTDYRLYSAEDWWYLEPNIRNAWDDLFDTFQNALQVLSRRDYDREKFKAAGLIGSQLKLKIGVWTKARDQAKRIWVRIKKTARRIPATVIHLLFDCAQTILGSLSFIPGVDAIEEFKSIVESIADASDQGNAPSSGRTDLEKVRMYFDFMKDLLIGLLIGGLFASILAGAVLEYNYSTSPTLWWVAYLLATTLLVLLYFGFRFWRNSVQKLGRQIDRLLEDVEREKPVKNLEVLLSLKKKRKFSDEGSESSQES